MERQAQAPPALFQYAPRFDECERIRRRHHSEITRQLPRVMSDAGQLRGQRHAVKCDLHQTRYYKAIHRLRRENSVYLWMALLPLWLTIGPRHHGPNRWRYSVEKRKRKIMCRKLFGSAFSVSSQFWNPTASGSRRRYPKYCIVTNARLKN